MPDTFKRIQPHTHTISKRKTNITMEQTEERQY